MKTPDTRQKDRKEPFDAPNLNSLFIEPEASVDKKQSQNASYLRREFCIDKPFSKATLLATACGLYKGFVNGSPISTNQLLPGCTFYKKRLQYQVYDVSSLLRQGSNAIGVILGSGWYRGKLGVQSKRYHYGEKVKLLSVLEIEFDDGSKQVITTDNLWKATQDGPIRSHDLKDGEHYDATREMEGWDQPGFDDHNWHEVYPATFDASLVPTEGEQVAERERFKPTVLITPDGSTVLDFSQNLVGYVEFSVDGTEGQTVKLTHGETLDENGNFTLKNVNMENPFFSAPKSLRLQQEVEVRLKNGAMTYKPSFSVHGFRYVKLENWPGDVDPARFTAIALYSDIEETGHFECSHPMINQLFKNAVWSQKGNFVDIPTDCPTRERAGWTGDIASFCEAGTYQMDTYNFLSRWMKDVALQQESNGKVPSIVPEVGVSKISDGSAGWADVATIVPYTLYKMYGDKTILKEQYASMKMWVDFVDRRAKKTRFWNKLKGNPNLDYLVDTGFHFGEWLEPGHSMGKDLIKCFVYSDAEVATAYFAYSANLLSQMAGILGSSDDQQKYLDISQKAKDAYRHAFTDNGIVQSKRQARYVRPIALDLLPEDDKRKNALLLNDMIVENQYRIGTGFLTTPFILPVLTDYGYLESAYRMIENEDIPGWLYNVKNGATTILENWEGIGTDGKPVDSFNHYAFGAVTQWLFTHVAGITPLEPGFQKIQIRPFPGGSLTHANCTYKSVAGPIKSSWLIENSTFYLTVETPSPTTVILPDGGVHQPSAGKHTFTSQIPA